MLFTCGAGEASEDGDGGSYRWATAAASESTGADRHAEGWAGSGQGSRVACQDRRNPAGRTQTEETQLKTQPAGQLASHNQTRETSCLFHIWFELWFWLKATGIYNLYKNI